MIQRHQLLVLRSMVRRQAWVAVGYTSPAHELVGRSRLRTCHYLTFYWHQPKPDQGWHLSFDDHNIPQLEWIGPPPERDVDPGKPHLETEQRRPLVEFWNARADLLRELHSGCSDERATELHTRATGLAMEIYKRDYDHSRRPSPLIANWERFLIDRIRIKVNR